MIIPELDIYLKLSKKVFFGYIVTDLEKCRGLITVDVNKYIMEPNRVETLARGSAVSRLKPRCISTIDVNVLVITMICIISCVFVCNKN
jgi:hypothetical protein